jgi:hypothetical protein
MAQQQNGSLLRIREYVNEARELQDDPMDFDASNTEARLEQTLQELQARVQEQQAALEKVCTRTLKVYHFTNSRTAALPVKCQPGGCCVCIRGPNAKATATTRSQGRV